MKADGSSLILAFTDIGSGLDLKPEPVSAFEVCGEDGRYVAASAKQVGDKVVVAAESVSAPVNVRYGWKKGFVPTLFNKEGLPASPFRTDSYPEMSIGRYYLDRNTVSDG